MTGSVTPAPLEGELELQGRIMPASNATFLADVAGVKVVYKPIAGERPLWDFPSGTLADREVAAYAVSQALGWDVVPHTWLGEGPHGLGMVQRWQDVDEDQEAVTIVRPKAVPEGFLRVFDGFDDLDHEVTLVHEDSEALRRMAVFDVVTNNADRKGGHVLAMPDGHRYGVDHGLTFHHELKLRTVLWGWAGDPLSDDHVDRIGDLVTALNGDLGELLAAHLTDLELGAFERRCRLLLERGVLPAPRGEWPAIPWPPF